MKHGLLLLFFLVWSGQVLCDSFAISHQIIHRSELNLSEKNERAFVVSETESTSVPSYGALTFEVKANETVMNLATLLGDLVEVVSAPILAQPDWQKVVVPFPGEIRDQRITVRFQSPSPLKIRRIGWTVAEDPRYQRPVCTRNSILRDGAEVQLYDTVEALPTSPASSGKKRLLFVGNSTIDGCGSTNGATVSFTLQSLIEAYFPGKFEVWNAGVGGGSTIGHIASVTDYYPLPQKSWPNIADLKYHSGRLPSYQQLTPDVIVLASHWNDIRDFRYFLAQGLVRDLPKEEKTDIHDPELSIADYGLDAFFRYLDNPIEQHARTFTERGSIIRPHKLDRTKKIRDRSVLERHFQFLTEWFIRRVSRHLPKTKIILMTLPNAKPHGLPDEAEIQRRVYQRMAQKFDLQLIDLSGTFIENFPENSRELQLATVQIFTDAVHFSPSGNGWLASSVFREIRPTLLSPVG